MNDTAIIILTNKDSINVQNEFNKLKSNLGDMYDFHILFHKTNNHELKNINESNIFFFTNDILHELNFTPYKKDKLIPGSNHFPLFKFAQNYDYKYYWIIEDDVRFSGDWSVFFNEFKFAKHDFISSHFNRKTANPNSLNCFNPIYRLSKEAITHLNHEYSTNKVIGHHEQTIPDLLFGAAYEILDFGGVSKFCPKYLREGFYNNSYTGNDFETFITHRCGNPFKKVGNIPNKIYHPVKDFE